MAEIYFLILLTMFPGWQDLPEVPECLIKSLQILKLYLEIF